MDLRPLCYVSIPFGVKPGPSGERIDFDDLYRRAVAPAVERAGLDPRRADTLPTSGVVQKAVYEAVLTAEVMVADISLANPNVLYELGIRHAARHAGTVLIASGPVPFDLQQVRYVNYGVEGETLPEALVDEFIERLSEAIQTARNGATDSPVHTLVPGLIVSLPAELPARSATDSFRARLLDVRRLPREDAIDAIRSMEKRLETVWLRERQLLNDVLLAYRDVAAWDEIVRLTSALPPELRDDPGIVQQRALALNRRGERDAAEHELRALVARTGGDSETFGLIGRIRKDRWNDTGDALHLDSAIDAYREGLKRGPDDLYPGINLATLLAMRGDQAAQYELGSLLPQLRDLLHERMASGQAGYWDLATSLELAVLAGDFDAARDLLRPAVQRAEASWMTESTAHNLTLLASTRAVGQSDALHDIISVLRQPETVR
jgi:hypothetical protein